MRALVTVSGCVVLRDVAEPVPAAHEAVVAVKAFSLNRGELRSILNNGEGWIPGQDVAGVVVTAAANGAGPPAGARVVALTDEFGWAERVAVSAHRMAVLPDRVNFAQASVLPVAGLTALRCLRLSRSLLGRPVLITGAAGGVGTLAVQMAARAGAIVTAVVGRTDRAAGLAALGAAAVAVGIETVQGRFALILESGGGVSLQEAVKLVEPGGTVVVYGNSANAMSSLSFGDFRAAQNARIQSFFYFTSEPEDRFAPDLAVLVGMIDRGDVTPIIGALHPWTEFAAVADALRDRRIAGKAVFTTEH